MSLIELYLWLLASFEHVLRALPDGDRLLDSRKTVEEPLGQTVPAPLGSVLKQSSDVLAYSANTFPISMNAYVTGAAASFSLMAPE